MMSWWNQYSEGQIVQAIENALTGTASLVHQASVTLDNDQIKALPTTTYFPIPTPGAGRSLDFRGARSVLDVRAGAYTGISALMDALFSLGSTDASTIVDLLPDMLADITDRWSVDFAPAIYDSGGPNGLTPFMTYIGVADIEDKPLRFSSPSEPDVNLGGGHADNSWAFAITFHVFDRALNKFLTTIESGWDEDTRTFNL